MSTKPTDLVRFAADGSDVDAVHISAPANALRDAGYAVDAIPTSDNFNYFLNRNYRWFKYVSEAAFQGITSFADQVTIGDQPLIFADRVFVATGTNDATHKFTAVAHGRASGDGPFRVSNSGGALPTGISAGVDYWFIRIDADDFKLAASKGQALHGIFVTRGDNGTGTHTISDTIDTKAIADLIASRDVIATGTVSAVVNVNVGFDLVVGNDASVAGDVVVGANHHVTISGSGSLKHGVKTRIISPKMSGGYSTGFGGSVFQAVVGIGAGPPPVSSLACPLDEYFIFGDRILEIRWSMVDSATGPAQYRCQVIEFDVGTGGTAGLGTSNQSDGSGTQQVLTVSGLTCVIRTGFFHSLSGFPDPGLPGGSGNATFFPFEVDFDHP